jgi:hypothetical protein
VAGLKPLNFGIEPHGIIDAHKKTRAADQSEAMTT